MKKKRKDYKITQKNIVKISIVGYGVIQDNTILNIVTENLKKNKIEIIDINLTQSKIEMIVKDIENNVLEELHRQLIKS